MSKSPIEKKVFIFGSGASARNVVINRDSKVSVGEIRLPTLNNLFQSVYSYLKKEHQDHLQMALGFADVKGKVIWKKKEYNFEEILNLIHTGGELFKSNWTVIDLKSPSFDLPFKYDSLEDSFFRAIRQVFSQRIGSPLLSTTHLKFAQEVVRPSDTIVTFNYDLLLDNALLMTDRWFPSDGYGIDFFNLPYTGIKSLSRLLKLHGSLNWVKYSGMSPGKSLHYDVGEYGLAGYREGYLHSPTDQCIREIEEPKETHFSELSSKTLILPPLRQKDTLDHAGLARLWLEFYESLSQADIIYVIGYSLPPSDTWIRDFLRLVAIRRLDTPPPKMHIVNSDSEHLAKVQEFFEKDLLWEVVSNRCRTFSEWVDRQVMKKSRQ